jgi:hypothetical protein
MGGLLIYYTPRTINQWLDDFAMLWFGGTLAAPYGRLRNQDGPARRDLYNGTRAFFFRTEEPLGDGLRIREDDEYDLDIETPAYIDWVLDAETGILQPEGTSSSFAAPQHEEVYGVLIRRNSEDYNILLTYPQISRAFTVAPPSCIASVLKVHVDRGSQTHRHSCQPIHNSGSWHGMVGVHINDGGYSTYAPNRCCL